ncbi:MAG: DUF167 domain-containing protein [Gemmatimonadetes bacterium]|nr:DUF167 domain-containing protein [Gemmatimonadota bacterium]
MWVQPRAARTEIAGRHGGSIKIRVAAPPVDGAANKELIRFLAERLDLPRSAVRVAGGHTGRGKRVVIEGLDARAVSDRLWGPDLTRGRPPE